MDVEDAISISSADSDNESYLDRRSILAPAIFNVVAALGGKDGDTYVLGDEALGCLKDLKKFWRKDDTDDERTVARIFWEARLLPNDLVPILLETAGKGIVHHKCAIACLDIMTAMTWPIDLAEELKELDDELDKGTDYTQLLQSHLHYKAALLQPGVIQALLGIMLPCLMKEKKERKERDSQIINVVLHLSRNLAFIKDQSVNIHASSDQAEFSSLQSKLIKTFHDTNVLELLLTMASNASSDSFLNKWNNLVLEIFYLLFRGVKPSSLTMDQTKRQQSSLSSLLEAEAKVNREKARKATTRHSRFGTTISVKLNPSKPTAGSGENVTASTGSDAGSSARPHAFVLHRQQALNKETGTIFDMKKRKIKKKTNQIDELGRQDYINADGLVILQDVAERFIRACFNPFLSSLLKDIKSERPKITEKDNVRLLFITKWFLEFFQLMRAQEKENAASSDTTAVMTWDFGFVAEVTERSWIVWILKRMHEALESKPKLWTELQAGIECLTQLLKLIDGMSSANITDPELNEAAEILQQQLVYNGDVLDIAIESLRMYKEGVQSLTYLDVSVNLAYTLLRMLERWSKGYGKGELYVRKKGTTRKRKAAITGLDEEGGMPEDAEPQEKDEQTVQETLFAFEAFEARFANEEITHTLMTYLARFQEFTSSEQMKRVVNLLHRQAVRAKAEGLFFKVSTLNLFKLIMAQQKMLPRDQPYKDLAALINYILKKFFKAIDEEPMLIIEAFFPKNRGRWKQYSSWEPEKKEKKGRREIEEDENLPKEVYIKKGYSWSQELGIAIAYLVDANQTSLIDWTKEILTAVIEERQKIVDETDGSSSQSYIEEMNDEEVREAAAKLRGPSEEALSKMENYAIKNDNEERSQAATKNSHLKLLFRLLHFAVTDQNADELEWYVPAAVVPSGLQSSLNIINQFLETPIDLDGKKAAQLIRKKRRSRRKRVSTSDNEEDADADFSGEVIDNADDEDEPESQKKAKKKKEKQQYKSAQFIEDSDEEYGDDEAFWAKEKALREKAALLAAEGKVGTMRSMGTKKRKKDNMKGVDGRSGRKKRKSSGVEDVRGGDADDEDNNKSSASESDKDAMDMDTSDVEMRSVTTPATTPPHESDNLNIPIATRPKPRPKPRPRFAGNRGEDESDKTHGEEVLVTGAVQVPRTGSPDVDTMQAAEISSPKDDNNSRLSDVEDDTGNQDVIRRKGKGRLVISDDDD